MNSARNCRAATGGRSGAMHAARRRRAPHACGGRAVCCRALHHADGGGGGQRRGRNSRRDARRGAARPRLCQQWRRHRAASRRWRAVHRRPDGPAGPPRPDANHRRSTPTIRSRGIATSGTARPQFFARDRRCGDGAGANGVAGRCRRHHHRQCRRSARPSRDRPLPGAANCSPTATSARALSPATSAHCREREIDDALEAGVGRAQQLLAAGLIEGAALRLLGETAVVAATGIEAGCVAAPFHGSATGRSRRMLDRERG